MSATCVMTIKPLSLRRIRLYQDGDAFVVDKDGDRTPYDNPVEAYNIWESLAVRTFFADFLLDIIEQGFDRLGRKEEDRMGQKVPAWAVKPTVKCETVFASEPKYGYRLNVSHPKIAKLYDRYKTSHMIHGAPSDAQRLDFERTIIVFFAKKIAARRQLSLNLSDIDSYIVSLMPEIAAMVEDTDIDNIKRSAATPEPTTERK